MPVLTAAGFRGVAPFMRGYAPTSAAPDGRYQSVLLAQDAVALLTALGAERAIIAGTGHFLHLERPEEVNQRIVAFLQAG